MSICEAIKVLQDQIKHWEEEFAKFGQYPDDYSTELSEAMEIVVETFRKEAT